MAQNKSKATAKDKSSEAKAREGGSWLKLPKMWADTSETASAEESPAGETTVGKTTVGETSASQATVDEVANGEKMNMNAQAEVEAAADVESALADVGDIAGDADAKPAGRDAPEPGTLEYYEAVGRETEMRERQALSNDLGEIKAEMERMSHIISELNERESSMEQVFDTLHSELMGYKKDFIYEHLKPVVRPLLFLYDSLEQFDHEIEVYERPLSDERRQEGLSPRLVRENIGYFREQLVEALRICEVTLMEEPGGEFDPKQHKAIDVAAVDEEQDGKIVRVVRTGWCLNNQVLRPVEVVLGKANLSKNEADKS